MALPDAAIGDASVLSQRAESLAQASNDSFVSGAEVPDSLVSYHLRGVCCSLSSDPRCVRILAQNVSAYARRLVESQAVSGGAGTSVVPAATNSQLDSGGGRGGGKKRRRTSASNEECAPHLARTTGNSQLSQENSKPQVLRVVPLLMALGVPEQVAVASSCHFKQRTEDL